MAGYLNAKKTLRFGIVVCSLMMAASMAAARPASARPSFLVILADDLGNGDLSSLGARDLHTPNIDSLAREGMRFDQFYANCPVCSPTRAALLTGRFPDRAGVPGVIRTHPENSWGCLSPNVPTLPKILGENGYHTALVGKWHLGLTAPNTPNLRGFDHFHGFLGDMMDDYYTHLRHGNGYMRLNETAIVPVGHATDIFSQWAMDYLDSRKDAPEPFFLFLSYNAPHTPIQPTEASLSRVLARESAIDPDRARLVALIEHLDEGIGRVLNRLESNGQAESTVVIFTSDNGGYLRVKADNGPLRDGKESMYEGGIRVPAYFRWPGHIAAMSVSSRSAMTMDLTPTLCALAGIDPPGGIDGQSLADTLREATVDPNPDRVLIWMRREGGLRYGGQAYYAARRGRWKLVQNTPFEAYSLFDLADDPAETRALSADHPEYGSLFQLLQGHIQRAGQVAWQPSDAAGL